MYYFMKTLNPRPTFTHDMTPAEHEIMERHVDYWSEKAALGIAIVFGPVMDPQGMYGVGVYQVQNEAEMHDLLEHDPANRLLRFEVLPMPSAVVGTLFI